MSIALPTVRSFLPLPARVFSSIAGLLCFGIVRAAVAQQQPSRAEELFERGLSNMRSGTYESACPDLAASYELEPLLGVLFTLADCEAAWGKIATAVEHYHQFLRELPALPPARRAKFDERQRLASERVSALGALVPLITLSVAAGAPLELVVKRNGTTIEPAAYGVAKPVDPGEFVITAEYGGEQWEHRVRLAAQERAQIQVPWPLRDATSASPAASPADSPAPPTSTAPSSVSTAPEASRTDSTLRTWKYVAGGVGIAGLTTSIVAGAIALGKKGDVDDNCPNYRCNPQGYDAVQSAQTAARISTVGLVVGLVGGAGLAGLFLLDGSQHKDAARDAKLRLAVDGTASSAQMHLWGSF